MEFIKGEVKTPDTIEEIISMYEDTLEDHKSFDMVEVAPRMSKFKNEWVRRLLKEKYDSMLPENERLAVMIGRSKYLRDEWGYERSGLGHNWSDYWHKKALGIANKILEKVDFETACFVIEIYRD